MEAPDGQSRASVATPAVFTSASAPKDPWITQQMDTTTVQHLIQEGLPDAKVEVSGADGVHFEALVVSPSFAGKLPLARHRMVYATLGELMGGAIHALSLRTLTPDEAGQSG
jgi:acid stress-induced BolA-like protein IbaG/YrbA